MTAARRVPTVTTARATAAVLPAAPRLVAIQYTVPPTTAQLALEIVEEDERGAVEQDICDRTPADRIDDCNGDDAER